MSGEEPLVARVTVVVTLADGRARSVTVERPDKVEMRAWREPVDLIATAGDPIAIGPAGASVSISGGEVSTATVPPQ